MAIAAGVAWVYLQGELGLLWGEDSDTNTHVAGASMTDASPLDYSYQELLELQHDGLMATGHESAPFFLGGSVFISTYTSGCGLSVPASGIADHHPLRATLQFLNASGSSSIYGANAVAVGGRVAVAVEAADPYVMRMELPVECGSGLWLLTLPLPEANCLITQQFHATTRYAQNATFASSFTDLSAETKQVQFAHLTEAILTSYSGNSTVTTFNATSYYALPFVQGSVNNASMHYSNHSFAMILAETWKSLDVAAAVYKRRVPSARRLHGRVTTGVEGEDGYSDDISKLDRSFAMAEIVIRKLKHLPSVVVGTIGALLLSIKERLADRLIPSLQEEIDEVIAPADSRRLKLRGSPFHSVAPAVTSSGAAVTSMATEQPRLTCGWNVLVLSVRRETFNLHRSGLVASAYPGIVASANSAWERLRPLLVSAVPPVIYAFVGGDELVQSVDALFARGTLTSGVLPSSSVVSVSSTYDNLCAASGSTNVFCDCAGSAAYQSSTAGSPLSLALNVRYRPGAQLAEREWSVTKQLVARTDSPSASPSRAPTALPSPSPTHAPTRPPSAIPTAAPTVAPTRTPTAQPTYTAAPTAAPSRVISSSTCINPLSTCPMYWFEYDICRTISEVFCGISVEGETVWVDLSNDCPAPCVSSADCGSGAICSSVGNACMCRDSPGYKCYPRASCTGEAYVGGVVTPIP